MSRVYRRYEMLLPLRFNDGQPIPGELVADVLIELRNHFGAVSCETQTIQGLWQHEGNVYRDELSRVFVDIPDTEGSREFFTRFKETLKSKFQQIDIWMTTYLVEVV